MKMKGTLPKPKMKNGKVQKPKKSKKLEKAEQAVETFEEMKKDLILMREEFQQTYPKAHAVLQEIHKQEDDTREQIAACKILVRDAGESIGEFVYTPKSTNEGYDGGKLLGLISSLPPETAGNMLKELSERGLITAVAVDKAAAKVIRASDPDLRDKLQDAWDPGGTPLTAAISTPNI